VGEITGHVDDQNAYLIGGRFYGFAYPLNGDERWIISIDGQRSGVAQCVCSFNGKLYATISDKSVWFVEIDLKTKNTKILSSTSAKEGQAPFVNVSPAPNISCMFADEEHNRLLVFVDDDRREWGGLWSMDGKSSEWTHLIYANAKITKMQALDSSRLLLTGSRPIAYAEILDLNALDKDNPLEVCIFSNALDTDYSNGKMQPLFNKWISPYSIKNCLAIYDNTMYGFFSKESRWNAPYWERLIIEEGAKPEQLAVPEHIKWPVFILPTPDNQGLIVGDGYSIVLLRFDDNENNITPAPSAVLDFRAGVNQ
jgi:hypothetical protein